MKEKLANEILQSMQRMLSDEQLRELRQVLDIKLHGYKVEKETYALQVSDSSGYRLLQEFLAIKAVEGKSQKTLQYYNQILKTYIQSIEKPLKEVTTNDLRYYLARYRKERNVGNVTLDNMRRIFSSFFGWLADEDYIGKSPAKRLNMIKVEKVIKKPFTHEERERIRCSCERQRDLAIIEMLYSTGARGSELIGLDKKDINFTANEAIVLGKGGKERKVYINEQSCLHLKNYLESRTDDNPALFVSIKYPHNRLSLAAVEDILRKLGRKAGVSKVHPHRYRRTMATNAMDRGMPVQEVSELLGHSKIETTMIYCNVSQDNVKFSHRKFLSA